MVYDPDDTIAAIGTATGAAPRGMVRLSGPTVLTCLQPCFMPHDHQVCLAECSSPTVVAGTISLVGEHVEVPCDLFYWPTKRSYTRQPTAELHTVGSAPLLDGLLRSVLSSGARLAEPGEFTLRAFLAGRLDLTQAEAVLGVIDAHSGDDLQAALGQLAGGLSKPLANLREKLLFLLAELEAGLDFVDEDIEFITADQLRTELTEVHTALLEIQQQLSARSDASNIPRVVLCGPPNVGKSSLFNALSQRYATTDNNQSALVDDQSGTTRDFVSSSLQVNGMTFELIDTAGVDSETRENSIDQLAQDLAKNQREDADLVIACADGTFEAAKHSFGTNADDLLVLTKSDLLDEFPANRHNQVAVSSVAGLGIDTLAKVIADQLSERSRKSGNSLSHTASRCTASLQQAAASTSRALQLVDVGQIEELIAAEVREALNAVGQVVGTVYTDDILDRIFGQFCIGK